VAPVQIFWRTFDSLNNDTLVPSFTRLNCVVYDSRDVAASSLFVKYKATAYIILHLSVLLGKRVKKKKNQSSASQNITIITNMNIIIIIIITIISAGLRNVVAPFFNYIHLISVRYMCAFYV